MNFSYTTKLNHVKAEKYQRNVESGLNKPIAIKIHYKYVLYSLSIPKVILNNLL